MHLPAEELDPNSKTINNGKFGHSRHEYFVITSGVYTIQMYPRSIIGMTKDQKLINILFTGGMAKGQMMNLGLVGEATSEEVDY